MRKNRSKKTKSSVRTSQRRPTLKQSSFAQHFIDPNSAAFGNATRAAELAGYKGEPGSNQLAVQGHQNLKNPFILQTIRDALVAMGFTAEHAARQLLAAMNATNRRVFLAKQGKLLYSKESPDHRVRLQAMALILRLFEKQGTQGESVPSALPAADSKDLPADVRQRVEEFRQLDRRSVPANLRPLAQTIQDLHPVDRHLMRSFFEKLERAIELSKRKASETDHPSHIGPPSGGAGQRGVKPDCPRWCHSGRSRDRRNLTYVTL